MGALELATHGTEAIDRAPTLRPEDIHTLRRSGRSIGDAAHETLLQAGAYAAGVLHHGTFDPRAASHIHYRNGKVTFSGTPAQKKEAAGLLSLNGTGNYLQKAGEDLFGIPVGVSELALNPSHAVPTFAKGLKQYYSRNPVKNLREDPFMFGLSYVLPAVSGVGSIAGRASAIGETAGALGPDANLSLADVARLRERGALQHAIENGGHLPQASPLTKARLLARAAIRTPVARERSFQVGDQTFSAPSSRNHAVNLFHRAVTDRLISHALDNGTDLLGTRSKVGRMVRANLRVEGLLRNADLSRLAKATKGLSAAQEHAAFILSKGHTAESYAKYAGNTMEKARAAGNEEAATALENQHELTKISAQYLKPGEEDPKVLHAAQVMREMIGRREKFYGRSEDQINHAIGSHFYGIHTRAEGLPDLHAELAKIAEEHGPAAESDRHFLDQHIANLERFAAQSGPEHAAELHADVAHLRTLENDVQFTQHRISQLDARIKELGPEVKASGHVPHPENLAATHRELLVERARLEDHLNTLVAHDRSREIHGAFEAKGAELRGQPITPEGSTTHVVAQNRIPGRIAAPLDEAQMSSLERHYGVEGRWTPEQAASFGEDMMKAGRGEPVPPAVQSVFNSSLVAPPEAFYLPFERDTKPGRGSIGQMSRTASVHGFGPAKQETIHRFTGAILDEGDFRTKASALATHAYSKAAHWQNMTDMHAMLWALSKETPEQAGRGRLPGRLGEPVPIRDISQVPESLKQQVYSIYPGDLLEGEAPDDIAQKLFAEWTKPPEHGEHVRWINRDFVRPLEPQRAGAVLRFINGINNGFRFGRYLNPGYARWLPQNLVLNLTQQGPFIFRNAAQMMTELQDLDPAVYHQIAESVSFGSARALESEGAAAKAGALQHKVASFWAHLNDHVPRMLSWIHEAQRAGFNDAKDWEALMTDPRLEDVRQGVIQRANKEPIDYGAMTARERVYMKSLFAYWPWIRAASLWALRFPFEHPYQMAAYQEAGREGKKKVADFWAKQGGIAPPYLEGYFPAKGGPVDTSISPWSQLAEDAQAFAGLSKSHPELAGEALGMTSPAARPIEELLSGRDQYGNVPRSGVAADALNSMARTFEPFSVFRTATDAQTGATPKGNRAAVLKYLGDPQLEGYDYGKGAKNALRDVTNFTRKKFEIENDPNAASVPTAEKQLVLRVAQIKDSTKSKSTSQIRALELASAVFEGVPLSDLNSLLIQNKLKPFSQGDLIAERARQRSIKP